MAKAQTESVFVENFNIPVVNTEIIVKWIQKLEIYLIHFFDIDETDLEEFIEFRSKVKLVKKAIRKKIKIKFIKPIVTSMIVEKVRKHASVLSQLLFEKYSSFLC